MLFRSPASPDLARRSKSILFNRFLIKAILIFRSESGVDRLAGCPFFLPWLGRRRLGLLLGFCCLLLGFVALIFCFGLFLPSVLGLYVVVVVVVVGVVVVYAVTFVLRSVLRNSLHKSNGRKLSPALAFLSRT